MYRTIPFSSAILSQSCKIRVDFPIPGSPPIKIRDPFTNPPPRTLSNSLTFDLVLISSLPITLFNLSGFVVSFGLVFLPF